MMTSSPSAPRGANDQLSPIRSSRPSALDSLLSWSDRIGILWAPDLSKQMPPQKILVEMDKAASSLTSDLRVLSGLGLTNLSAEKATDMVLEALIDEAKA